MHVNVSRAWFLNDCLWWRQLRQDDDDGAAAMRCRGDEGDGAWVAVRHAIHAKLWACLHHRFILQVRFQIIRNARTSNAGNRQSCMVSKCQALHSAGGFAELAKIGILRRYRGLSS